MSCGAFGSIGNCGSGGVGGNGMPGSHSLVPPPICGTAPPPMPPARCADRGFFDPFCMPIEKPRNEPSCYFNPFVHAQCLGVDMNMEGFRNDILKCQEDYKKAVWAVLKKYAVGENSKDRDKDRSNSNRNNFNSSNNFMRELCRNANPFRRSISTGFQNDDPRLQRNRRNMPFYGNMAQ